MNFDLTSAQSEFRKKLTEFAATELNDNVTLRDQESCFSEELWKKCADFGILGMNLPLQYGSHNEVDILTAVIGMEGLGIGCRDRGLLLALNVQLWSVQLPILRLGTEQQKANFLPKLGNGSWKAAHAMTEPDAGSDAYGIKTTAEKTDGGYVLNGHKCMVTLGPLADLVMVTATTDPEKGKWGLSTFLVEKDFDGLSVGGASSKMGLRTVPFAELKLDNCFVPDSHRLGTSGDVVALQALLEVERCCILATHIGAMDFQLKQAIQHVRRRRQFGQSIGRFQSISNRIADMKVRLETSRLLLYRTAWLKSQGRSAVSEAAMLKLYLSESFVESSMDAMRIHGGRGYMTEYGVERDLRDAMGGVFYAGTSDIQRNVIAGMMGVG